MNDIGKVALLGAILGAILLVGVVLQPRDRAEEIPEVAQSEAVIEEPVAPEITVVSDQSIELLDPIYSEKAVFQDDAIRIAFDSSFTEAGVESRIPFWLHNISRDVVNIIWDRCSLQLPSGNTVHIVNEESLATFGPMSGVLTVPPAGDLFDAIIPVSELVWSEEEGWSVTSAVLDKGTFTMVLAIERSCSEARMMLRERMSQPRAATPECSAGGGLAACGAPDREIVYYTFRFVVR